MSVSQAQTDRCDVLVVGAGPAGSACAQTLARAGLDVCLIDQHDFPRDKACGDGLIPDAHAALERLGALDEVMSRAQAASHVACVGPRGGRIEVPGRLAVLPRRELDDILRRSAVATGARWLAPARFERPRIDGDRVAGAELRLGDATQVVRSRWTVLATGAVPQALIAAGVCERRVPSGVALRGYVRHAGLAQRLQALEVVWHRRLRPGYGWIFPCRDGVFNVGVGISHSHRRSDDGHGEMADVNLREVFDTFIRVHPAARELMAGGERMGALKGAPLRYSLEGARYSRDGLLVTGEAAGSTYSFTGEGIGKALETGLLAAQAIVQGGSDADVRAWYGQQLLALKPRFDLYERANLVNAHPWLADLVIWRARRSERLLRRMSGVLEETSNPGHLISWRGMARLFVE
jgi:geranylgeranyl reductase family protein